MRGVFNDVYAFFLLLIFFIKAYHYVIGTHLNCLSLQRQFKLVPTTYALYKNVDKSRLVVI